MSASHNEKLSATKRRDSSEMFHISITAARKKLVPDLSSRRREFTSNTTFAYAPHVQDVRYEER
jgi:hypothetical protein